jgi:hypothetical protein
VTVLRCRWQVVLALDPQHFEVVSDAVLLEKSAKTKQRHGERLGAIRVVVDWQYRVVPVVRQNRFNDPSRLVRRDKDWERVQAAQETVPEPNALR